MNTNFSILASFILALSFSPTYLPSSEYPCFIDSDNIVEAQTNIIVHSSGYCEYRAGYICGYENSYMFDAYYVSGGRKIN